MNLPYLMSITREDLHKGHKLTDVEWLQLKESLKSPKLGFMHEVIDIVDEFAETIILKRDE